MFSLKRDTFEAKTKYQKIIQRVNSFMTKYEKKQKAKIKEIVEKVVEKVVKEALKFEVSINDVDFFDFTLQLNIFKLYLTTTNANFLQQLKNSTIKFNEKSILSLLNKCLREFVCK